jgi:purine-binding chemotaxis protein CheW
MDENPRQADLEVTGLIDDWLTSVSDGASASDAPAPDAASGEPAATIAEPDASLTLLDALAARASDGGAERADTAAPAAPVDAARRQRYVLFSVAGSTYGVLESCVTEIGRVPRTTIVPRTPAWVRGVASLRGDVLSVIDVRTLLGLEPAAAHAGRLLVARLVDEDFSVGLLVDSVDQIASVPAADIRPPASPLSGALADFLTGGCQLTDRFVAVLDLDRLLRSAEIRQFDDRKEPEPGATTRGRGVPAV